MSSSSTSTPIPVVASTTAAGASAAAPDGSVVVKVKKELTDEEKKAAAEKKAADEKAAAEKAGSKTKRVFIKVGILLAMIAIIVLITIFSGYIAKLMMKASSCNETKILLVTAGVLTSVIFMGLGYLFAMTESGKGYFNDGMAMLTAEEQYRYYRR